MSERVNSGLRRESPWQRIEQEIQREINNGVLKPQDRLRSEKDLAKKYKVGLYVVRKALKCLQEKGLLYSKPRSGMYVAEASQGLISHPSDGEDGLHTFEIIQGAVCHLKFLVTGWTSRNKGMWERICRNASLLHPDLNVEPLFPRSAQDFELWFKDCDLTMMSVSDGLLQYGKRRVALLDQSEMTNMPLADRYTSAVKVEGGKILGVPFSGTFLVGGINDTVTPAPLQRRLVEATAWSDVLGILASRGEDQPQAACLNLHPYHTLNLAQYFAHTGGFLVDPATSAVRIGEPVFRDALRELEEMREKDFKHGEGTRILPAGECCVFLEWTYMFHRNPAFVGLTPWLFPLGRQGSYLEGLNVCAISQDTPYPAECRKVLHYFLSDSVQREIAQFSGEHSVSGNIPDPFEGYPERWRPTLRAMYERSRVFCEVVPGYIQFLNTIVASLSVQFCSGRITADELIRQMDEKGTLFFARNRFQMA